MHHKSAPFNNMICQRLVPFSVMRCQKEFNGIPVLEVPRCIGLYCNRHGCFSMPGGAEQAVALLHTEAVSLTDTSNDSSRATCHLKSLFFLSRGVKTYDVSRHQNVPSRADHNLVPSSALFEQGKSLALSPDVVSCERLGKSGWQMSR
ncbi:hypothetical protein RRG08_009993 [Elysia crispata]|uniref:Uncharacterized protein n=1 Tax=Elysia crispata TaxID=231223 RepID=A0AAE0ZTD3_9GAST|nr:hypothetical protein RRG08_009993 [Elysia crispata]